MNRTIYAYAIEAVSVNQKKVLSLKSLEEDLKIIIEEIEKLDKNDRKFDLVTDKKVVYIDTFEYMQNVGIINLKFVSAKYFSRRNVVDTDTMLSKGILKDDKDGDEEKTHVCFKFTGANTCDCLCESNRNGVGLGKILKYLEHFAKQHHRNLQDGIYYNLQYKNIVSRDFLESLRKLTKIKAVTLTVDQEDVKVSDFKAVAGKNDIRKDVDIMLKPESTGIGILRDTVKEFYELYTDKKRIVKKVTVEGDALEREPLSFNTEQMKDKRIIHVDETYDTREADTRSVFERLYAEILSM